MSKQNFRDELAKDLHENTSAQEADSLLRIADTLLATPKITRSKAARSNNWRFIRARFDDTKPSVWHKIRFVAIPSFALFAILSVGTVIVSQNAVPGDITYNIKRMSETVQFAVATSPAKKADLCSVQMKRRANELARMSATTNDALVASLTSSILEEANEFKEFADKAGADSPQLEAQRKRDALYVIEALQTAQNTHQDANQAQDITNTIEQMQKIANA